jgi:hypothetical protein
VKIPLSVMRYWPVIFLLVSIALIFISQYSPKLISPEEPDLKAVYVLVLAFTSSTIAILLILISINSTVNDDIEKRVDEAVQKEREEAQKVTCKIGQASKVSKTISDKFSVASQITNTYFANISFYTVEADELIADKIVKFVKRGGIFHDYSTPATKHRQLNILEKLSEEKSKGSYRAYCFEGGSIDVTPVNFILIDYEDITNEPSEVYFGWGMWGRGKDEDVIKSSSQDITGFFRGLTDSFNAAEEVTLTKI